MNTNLTPTQIESYRDNGFVVIADFLNADEVADWCDAVDEAVTGRKRERIPGFGQEEENNEGYYNNVFIQRVNLWQTNEKMRQLMLDARLGQMAATLAGIRPNIGGTQKSITMDGNVAE